MKAACALPYLIKVPWLDIAGKKSNAPVAGTDFYTTLLELIGKAPKPEEHQDGKSLVPLLTGSEMDERPLIWHYPHYGNQGGEPSSVIRRGEWKLIHYYEDGREELYNLHLDLEETNDVSAENVVLTKALREQLFAHLNEVGAQFPRRDPQYSAELERAYLRKVEKERLPQLELRRQKFLSRDYDPGNDWWGSRVRKCSK